MIRHGCGMSGACVFSGRCRGLQRNWRSETRFIRKLVDEPATSPQCVVKKGQQRNWAVSPANKYPLWNSSSNQNKKVRFPYLPNSIQTATLI